MTNDPIRAALERLIEDTEYLAKGGEDLDRAWVAIAAGKAALAEQQGEGPSDEDLLQVAINTRLCRFQATAGDPVQYELTEAQINAYARAVLARWGHPAPALNQVFAGPTTGTDVNAPHFRFLTANDLPTQQVEIERLETPPAEGEVAELVEWLKANSSGVYRPAARAAELLQRQEVELQECRQVSAAFEEFNQQRETHD